MMFLLPLAIAQEEVGSPPAAAPSDFTAGFQKLVALGLPSLDGAEWMVAAGESAGMDDYELREVLEGMKGSGWKVQLEGKAVFVQLGGIETGDMPTTAGGGSGGGLLGAIFGGGSKKPKATGAVDDANTLIKTLSDPEKSKQFRSRLEYMEPSSLGRLLIYAAQLHQTGHPAEANRLTSVLFTLGVSPETIIDSAIDRIAARDQKRITEAFFSSHDWVAYERNLRELVVRYPRGWGNHSAVQMLLPAVSKRAAKTPPPKPSMLGITLNPDAVAALEEALTTRITGLDEAAINAFARERGISTAALTPQLRQQIGQMLSNGDRDQSNSTWLIEESSKEKATDPQSRLKQLGLDALPALAAVTTDETLTESPNPSSSDSSHYSSRSNQESEAEKALTAYQSMERPMSRGELACRLLRSTLPGESIGEADPATLAETAIRFWKVNQGKSKLDLLLAYIVEADASQKSSAFSILAVMPEPAAIQAFQRLILGSEDPSDSSDAVILHLKARKTAAKDFFTKYSAALNAQLDGAELENLRGYGSNELRRAGSTDKFLKTLSVLVGGTSPRKLALELAGAVKPERQQIAALAETMAESSKDEFMTVFLEAAIAAKSPATRTEFVSAIYRQSYQMNSSESEEEEKEPADTPIPASQIPLWSKLFADEQVVSNDRPLRQYIASLLEQIHSPGDSEKLSLTYQLDPTAYVDLLLTRAKDRLAGKSPTPLPDPAKVTDARLQDLVKQLDSAKPETIHDQVMAWTLDEKSAFHQWRSDPEKPAKISANLAAARRYIAPLREQPGSPPIGPAQEILKSLELAPGTKVDANTLVSLATKIAPHAKENSGLTVALTPSFLETGYLATACRVFDLKPSEVTARHTFGLSSTLSILSNSSAEPDAVTVLSSSQSQDERAIILVWTLKDSTVTPPAAAEIEKFREAMAALDQANGKSPNLAFSVLHREDLEKYGKLRSFGNESGEEADPSDQ